jgi:GntR family transcriptional regulator/MocR family aminotransferase
MARTRRELEWPIRLDRESPQTLGDQLAQQLRGAIMTGQLLPGTLLPSTRSLARALAISRTTTFNVYERLLSEGYLVAHHGSGTRVSEELPAFSRSLRAQAASTPRWLHRPPLPSLEVEHTPKGAIAFSTGITTIPAASLARWQSSWRQCAREPLPTAYGSPAGEHEFRAVLAAYLGRARGIACTADDIVITGGTMRAMDLLLQAALLPGDRVGVEEPGYPLARQLLLARELHPVPLPVDDGGLRVADLPTGAKAPRAAYVTPSHQYPLGGRLSVGRRHALLEWAGAHGVLLVEDDYDSEFRFDAPPLPALAALDGTMSQVAYLGTFSKVLTPAVRCGYMVVPPPLRERIVQLALRTEFHPDWSVQRVLTHFMREGHLELHIRRMRQHYAHLRAALTRELSPLAPQAALRGLEAGLHAVLELPCDPDPVIQEAGARGVVVSGLDEYFMGPPTTRGLMLGYGGLSVETLVRGARHLAQIIAPRLQGGDDAPLGARGSSPRLPSAGPAS